MAMALTPAALQPFRAATATSMSHSATLVTSVSGGLLPRAMPPVPTTGAWATISAMYSDTTAITPMGFLCVVLGIYRLFDYFSI